MLKPEAVFQKRFFKKRCEMAQGYGLWISGDQGWLIATRWEPGWNVNIFSMEQNQTAVTTLKNILYNSHIEIKKPRIRNDKTCFTGFFIRLRSHIDRYATFVIAVREAASPSTHRSGIFIGRKRKSEKRQITPLRGLLLKETYISLEEYNLRTNKLSIHKE